MSEHRTIEGLPHIELSGGRWVSIHTYPNLVTVTFWAGGNRNSFCVSTSPEESRVIAAAWMIAAGKAEEGK